MVELAPSNGKPDKMPLHEKMYFRPHFTELTRLVGYEEVAIDDIRKRVDALGDRFGREIVQAAGYELLTFNHQKKTVKLTDQARKLAAGILGFPPEYKETPIAEMIYGKNHGKEAEKPEQKEEPKAESKPRKRRQKKATTEAASEGQPLPDVDQAPGGADRATPPHGEVLPTNKAVSSPLMVQYREAKDRHPGMLLLFRVGDFYEMFDSDAEKAAKLLKLTLTTRDRTIPMTGFPHHALEQYLRKLLQAGERVAICDQVDSDDGKSIKREVQRVVTPDSMVEPEETPAVVTQVGETKTKIPVKLRKRTASDGPYAEGD